MLNKELELRISTVHSHALETKDMIYDCRAPPVSIAR